MIPTERSLVGKLKNKPFALLGVNTDESVDFYKQSNKGQLAVTWRSWYDGQGGPICQQYKIQSFPTLMLIDAKGVIRSKDPRVLRDHASLEKAINDLLKEAQTKK